ncbi:BON domain-containing protein [Noviherbaspirillum cavernae]|uniref:Osmotically-inducible protein Y n=2 Tax=Noviherbaspirillum cavernae TaxID=2320862 RepID=A0A418X6M8_9BURK|nr:BON domain-containing protein [Noviherbaspirillum cavernae]
MGLAIAGCDRKAPDQAGPGGAPGTPSSTTGGQASPGGTIAGQTTPPAGTAPSSAPAASAAASIDDSIITTKVKTALLADTDVKGSDISVETKQGEVMLGGSVQSQAQIDKALKIANAVDGVKSVDNKMLVKQ